MKLMIVMPAYNENATIRSVVEDWHAIAEKVGEGSRLVVANDGSSDDTLDILRELAAEKPLLTVLDKPNGGHGDTLLHLYRHALEQGAEYVFQTDSDGQTLTGDFGKFWQCRDCHDIQIGVRESRSDGLMRVAVAWVLKLVVRLTCGVTPRDANTPFRLVKGETLRRCLSYIPDGFFLANVALTVTAMKTGCRVGWKSIGFRARQGGSNSIGFLKIVRTGFSATGALRRLSRRVEKSNKNGTKL